jgi:hypothetical protein
VHLAGFDLEIDALQDVLARDAGLKSVILSKAGALFDFQLD